jgi:hypothetical protein
VNHSGARLRKSNRLRVCELANPGGTEFASKTGTLHDRRRQTRIGAYHSVDENHSSLKARGEEFLFLGLFVHALAARPNELSFAISIAWLHRLRGK